MGKFWIGTAVYVTLVGGVIASAAVAFDRVVGLPAKGASNTVVEQMGPVQRTSGKWTPVEIKRETKTPPAPALPPYVAPRLAMNANATTAMIQPQKMKQPQIRVLERKMAEHRQPTKKVMMARRGYAPEERQLVAAYAAPEPTRFFGPFRFPF